MKILLDENIDVGFKDEFEEFEVFTVHDMQWHSKQNGELLKLAFDSGFDFLITLDKNIKHQQKSKQDWIKNYFNPF